MNYKELQQLLLNAEESSWSEGVETEDLGVRHILKENLRISAYFPEKDSNCYLNEELTDKAVGIYKDDLYDHDGFLQLDGVSAFHLPFIWIKNTTVNIPKPIYEFKPKYIYEGWMESLSLALSGSDFFHYAKKFEAAPNRNIFIRTIEKYSQ